jgi:hypothetical protein
MGCSFASYPGKSRRSSLLENVRPFALVLSCACMAACAAPAETPPPVAKAPSFEAFAKSPLESWAASVARGPAETRVAVTGRAASVDGHSAIAFTLTNVSGKPLRLWTAGLPWGNTNSIDLVAITTDGRVLKELYPIDDPGPERLVIAPGQVLSGIYPLDNFEDLEERRKTSDVIVLWSYRLRLQESDAEGVSSGVLVLGKRMD